MSGAVANCEGVIEVKIMWYDEIVFIVPVGREVEFVSDESHMNYLTFLEKWEKFKYSPDDLKLYTDEI